MRKNDTLYRMTIAAMLMAIGMVLPRLLGGTEVLGQSISPLHIPALIAGLTLGGFWGGVVGFASPLLGHLALQAPPTMDKALPMAVECLAYGVISGILYALLLRLMKGKPRIIPLLTALTFGLHPLNVLVGKSLKKQMNEQPSMDEFIENEIAELRNPKVTAE